MLAVPYLLRMMPDAAADIAPDAPEAQSVDADRDASPLPLDVRTDIPPPALPYLLPAMLPDELSPAPLAPPEKK